MNLAVIGIGYVGLVSGTRNLIFFSKNYCSKLF